MKTPTETKRLETAAKVAGLTLANALVFQEQLALTNPSVEPLRRVLRKADISTALATHWDYICKNINYVPIFSIARDILESLPSSPALDSAIKHLTSEALSISARRAALRHDLMGRIYHFLLHDAKYLGTYYTSVPAATLLLKVALAPARWNIDWAELEEIRKQRFADLACGTGTLLMAASQAVTDNFIRASAQKGRKLDRLALRDLHRALMEDTLHGYDVLPSAVHLTAATLGLLAPEIAFKKMQLFCLPLGKGERGRVFLGSIEYLTDPSVRTQLDLMGHKEETVPGAVTGAGVHVSEAPVPELTLCAMNPPFVRSVGGNLLFGSLTRDRAEMQKELKKRLHPARGIQILANTTAGLGSVFTAVGDRRLKAGGTLALVLPAAITTGVAWQKTRSLFDGGYSLEYVIASHDADRWAFSENTDLSEVLLVAKKRATPIDSNALTLFVSLWKNPRTIVEAQSAAEALLMLSPAAMGTHQLTEHGVTPLVVGGQKVGELLSVPTRDLVGKPWIGASFAHTELNRALWYLADSIFVSPGSAPQQVSLCKLNALVELGPDRRDVYDAFARVGNITTYPAFWSHDADAVTTIESSPNTWLSPLARPRAGRRLRPVSLVWPRAGALMIAERMRLNTQRILAVRLEKPALSNVWWPTRLRAGDDRHEKALALWLNSSLGVLIAVGHRTPTEGPWVQFKKPALSQMPTLNVSALGPQVLNTLANAYDSLSGLELEPLSRMATDQVRRAIDDAISGSLGLGDLGSLRTLLALEPVVSGRSLTPVLTEDAEFRKEQLALF